MFQPARPSIRVGVLLLACGAGDAVVRGAEGPARVEYNRDVRPILADRCFSCHGPDGGHRKAGLRLDRRDEAVAAREGVRAIVPGDPEESEVISRITAEDDEARMPPHNSGAALPAREVELLRRWIEQGAGYQPHWSFLPPAMPSPPPVIRDSWPRGPVDRFILAELERRGMAPAPEGDRANLLRRVSLDLTGLPPTPEELDDFLADASPDAYERAVERLLASPRFGERMALDWLDSARFADTNGYYTDTERHAWPWRDWVIRAFNRNLPFDRFTIEQLAGDLLPGPATERLVATGFNRNHMVTNETGAIDEEYRVSYVVDRVDTTATVWLGLTVGCARCHDHKFDPISQAEYYRLFAFFNGVEEKGLVKDASAPAPVLALPSAEQERRLADIRGRRERSEARLRAAEPALATAIASWEGSALAELPRLPASGNLAHLDLERDGDDRGPHHLATRGVGTLRFGAGVLGSAATFDGSQHVELMGGPELDRPTPFSLSVWVKPGKAPTGCVISKMDTTPAARGFEVIWYKSRPWIRLVQRPGRGGIEVVADATFAAGSWHHLAVTYDGSGTATGVKLYVDGARQAATVRRDDLAGTIASEAPWQVAWKGSGVGFEGSLDELRLYDRPLGAAEVNALHWHDMLRGAIETRAGRRSAQQVERLRAYYIDHHAPDETRRLAREVAAARDEEADLRREIVKMPVMQEAARPRETFILARGRYDQPTRRVAAGVPVALGGLPPDLPRDRLGLARWLVGPTNPLTARVIVNRYWQLAFGRGLVRTIDDFGLQGELPSHPALLDWLAAEFVRSGWDVKGLLRLLVTSATYRQSSRFTPELLADDPENRLLARGPRYRLPAESIRDQALAVGGLLAERLGGPSVKPYQPAGVWEAVSYNGDQVYEQGHGAALYRRGLYTFWKRQAPPPTMLTFDGPTRETCVVRRARTNTPLQSLALLNDVTYVEAARGLATLMMGRGGDDPAGRVRYGFRRATGRTPEPGEVAALVDFTRCQLAAYRDRPEASGALLRAGESPADPALDPRELAAWTLTASILLNLDETITQH